ncbi:uncharacterized protein LOC117604393 [Osmia lignaria lignaria]|uniref:uncharacterized protein LOC117604393 n=1 Tax=Osmia lignaria lignaria TaxID=1437193 RepID=UPI00402BDF7C
MVELGPRRRLGRRSRTSSQCIGCFRLAGTFGAEQLVETHATCNNMPIRLRTLCLVTLVLCNIADSLEHEIPRRSFLSRRAIDGTRGRKYFDPEEEGAFDSYGSAGGQYDPYEEKTDLSDIRRNVPGEPGVDYPAYTTLPQTGFTCEGRSRGYYADEVAGCQVFHVCHDVLVSSFLCPIGSIFSQKLLTCDWWTKVDCSSSGKYIDVNRNSYQQDDDEMIRNAYAMISLQSGTDVTKDGLVDPDRTGSVVDYQRAPARIPDYSSLDTTGNDLRNNYEDYSSSVNRNFLPPYQSKDRKIESSPSYQERFYPPEKSRSPYQDSPIIRVQNIKDPGYRDAERNKHFQENYRRPNEFSNQFQPSYAPTVPTVTTTTRRFYSPTVPTTFRPSTLAYNKLDQEIDSSDYYFSHSRTNSFVTPASRNVEDQGVKKSEAGRKANDYSQQDSYEDDYDDVNSEEERQTTPSGERFRIRVADDYRVNRTGLLFGQVYRGFDRARDDEEILEDIETRGSIGLGHALGESFRGISVQQQNPVNDGLKDGEAEVRAHHRYTLTRPESSISSGNREEETTEQYQRNDQREQGIILKEDLVSFTTPSVIESTIKATTNLHEFNSSSVPVNSKNSTEESSNQKHSIKRVDKFLRPPEESRTKFQINVPDLSEVSTLLIRYSTVDDGSSRTTELPSFRNTYSDDYIDHPTAHDESVSVTRNYEDIRGSGEPGRSESTTDINRFRETVTPRLDKEPSTSPVTKLPIIESSRSTSKSGTAEDETPTTLIKPIRPETLKQIEESIEKNNSPYHVTLTVNKDEELIPTAHDLIGKLIAQQGKESSTVNDKLHELEIIKSVEPKLHPTDPPTSPMSTIDTHHESNTGNNHSRIEQNSSRSKDFDRISLLQLMSELLKLDRAPRPFSLSDAYTSDLETQPEVVSGSSASQTIAKEVNLNMQFQEEVTEKLTESSTEPVVRSTDPRLKDHILDQLAETFGEPLLKTDRPLFDLPQKNESDDFLKGLPTVNVDNHQESSSFRTTLETSDRFSSRSSSKANTIITTTSEPGTTLTTDSGKTVVKTEFVPSIGFSFDTDRGREEYVEAVLGGLIEPEAAESEKKEAVIQQTSQETLSEKNETSKDV